MGKSIYNGTSPYEYIDFLERRNAELEEEVDQLRAEILAQMTRQAQAQGEYDDRASDAAE